MEALGEKGVKELLELLKNIGEGQIDRESGITTLVTVFGLDQKTAEEICPQVAPKEEHEKPLT
jgi:hypothetical protein